jgi:hypothetical protein
MTAPDPDLPPMADPSYDIEPHSPWPFIGLLWLMLGGLVADAFAVSWLSRQTSTTFAGLVMIAQLMIGVSWAIWYGETRL